MENRIVIGQIINDGDTKVYVRSLAYFLHSVLPGPQWGMFTYTKRKNMPAGTYLFRVREIHTDKRGYENAVVDPVVTLEGKKDITGYADILSLMLKSEHMADMYREERPFESCCFREIFVTSKAKGYFGVEEKDLADAALEHFMKKDIDLDQLHELFHEEPMVRSWKLSEWSSRMRSISRSFTNGTLGEEGYPLTEKRLRKKVEGIRTPALYDQEDISDDLREHRYFRHVAAFSRQMDEAYLGLLDKGLVENIPAGSSDRDILERCEAVARYYEEKKKKEKEEKRNRRKKA